MGCLSEVPKEALMLHVGLDLSRRRVDVCVLDDAGGLLMVLQAPPDADGLRQLAARFDGEQVRGVVESMTGARFVHDMLEGWGWTVEIADAQRVKALAPLTAKTDRIDARVLADLSLRDLIPAVWLPPPEVRGMRELARFRLHLVKHRTGLKNRIHSTLMSFGRQVPVADLFGLAGRELLSSLNLPEMWQRTVTATLEVIDHLDSQVHRCDLTLGQEARRHPDVSLLQTAPGIGPVLGYTIVSEVGDIHRFPTPKQLVGYTGLCPQVHQSGESEWHGPLTKHGPCWLRWAYIEAAVHASGHPAYRPAHDSICRRLGPRRGAAVARVDTARRLATATWWMLTKHEPFHPASPLPPLAA
jgi:transposase